MRRTMTVVRNFAFHLVRFCLTSLISFAVVTIAAMADRNGAGTRVSALALKRDGDKLT